MSHNILLALVLLGAATQFYIYFTLPSNEWIESRQWRSQVCWLYAFLSAALVLRIL